MIYFFIPLINDRDFNLLTSGGHITPLSSLDADLTLAHSPSSLCSTVTKHSFPSISSKSKDLASSSVRDTPSTPSTTGRSFDFLCKERPYLSETENGFVLLLP